MWKILSRLMPAALKGYVHAKVRTIVRSTLFQDLPEALPGPLAKSVAAALTFQSLPVAAHKYIPYRRADKSYLLPGKVSLENLDCDNGLPIPPSELWNAFGESREIYLATGFEQISTMRTALIQSGFTAPKGPVLDFGCGAGRMLRHLKDWAATGEVWGVDISAEHIHWCAQHLEPPFRFATVTTIPHLPFADGYFQVAYAGSVFTHIEDLSKAWLLELARVISPGGWLYVTIHDESSLNALALDHTNSMPKMIRSDPYCEAAGKNLGMWVVQRDEQSQVFYAQEFFRKLATPFFDLRQALPMAYGMQTGILLQRR